VDRAAGIVKLRNESYNSSSGLLCGGVCATVLCGKLLVLVGAGGCDYDVQLVPRALYCCQSGTQREAPAPEVAPGAGVGQDDAVLLPLPVRFSEACERNKEPILQVLRQWLPPRARVLEVGSGSGQHAVHFARQLAGLQWQPSDRAEYLAGLRERISLEGREGLAPGARLADPLELDVDRSDQWPRGPYEAVFSANTTHIMAAASVPRLLAGAARVLEPGGLLLIYGPFLGGGAPAAPSNAAFDAHLRSLDPTMGVRDAREVSEQALSLGLAALADEAMPANNSTLIFRKRDGLFSPE
jgi:SAM-dependent methyltransferase